MKMKWVCIVVATALMIVSLAKPALAGPFTDGIPDHVEFGETGLLLVLLNNALYASQPSSPGCGIGNASIDTRKIWVNLTQAALLSGKSIRIYFTVCNGQNWIRDIVLTR